MKKVLCIGEALIDMICTDKGSTLAAGEHFLKKTGGAPTNVAAAVAALGGSVSLLAKVGRDPFGDQLIQVMHEFGVDTRYVFRDDLHFTTLAFVSLMENGERDFVFSRGADGFLSADELKEVPMEDIHTVHFGSATAFLPGPLQEAYKALLHQSLNSGKFISFDPNYRHLLFKDCQPSFIEQSWYFLERCHFFKVSDEEALLITGSTNLEDAIKVLNQRTKSVFAITLGKEGTLLHVQQADTVVPSISVEVTDTTGAGDAFVGAMLYQLTQFDPLEIQQLPADQWIRITANANKAGARTCAYMGAMEAFRHLNNNIFQ